MLAAPEIYLSEILDRPVTDRVGERIGRIHDLLVACGESFPKVTAIMVARRGREVLVGLDQVQVLNRRLATLNVLEGEIRPENGVDERVLLRRDILDKQIVDTHDVKVVRVNDIKVASIGHEMRVVAVDIGTRGLLRRLGVERAALRALRFFRRTLGEILVRWDFLEPLESRVDRVKLAVPQNKLAELHPAEIADIVNELHPKESTLIVERLDDETAAETLSRVEPETQVTILENMDSQRASDILESMSPDDATDIVSEMNEEKAAELLNLMEAKQQKAVRSLMAHDEDTPGGLMTTEYIAFKETLTAEKTINCLRELAPDAEVIYYLYVIDAEEKLRGVLSLRDLIVAPPATPLSEIMTERVVSVGHDDDLEKVKEIFVKYDFLALPVTGDDGKLLGVITVDDAIDLILAKRRRTALGRLRKGA